MWLSVCLLYISIFSISLCHACLIHAFKYVTDPFQEYSYVSFAGSIVYNETDHDGHCYLGYCDESCHVVQKHYKCEASGKDCNDETPPREVILYFNFVHAHTFFNAFVELL